MSEIKPVYQTLFIATEFPDGWHEVDKQVHDVRANHPDQFKTRILYPAAAYEALQKENAELRDIYVDQALEINEKIAQLTEANAAQAKRIEELEAATEHLGLTPKQASDGLARYKAQVAEIESLRKQVESVKYFLLTCASPDCVFAANTLRDQANTLLDQISASKNGE